MAKTAISRNDLELTCTCGMSALVVSGMAANAVSGGHRMGAIFDGMMLSGERAAGWRWRLLGQEEIVYDPVLAHQDSPSKSTTPL